MAYLFNFSTSKSYKLSVLLLYTHLSLLRVQVVTGSIPVTDPSFCSFLLHQRETQGFYVVPEARNFEFLATFRGAFFFPIEFVFAILFWLH